MSFYNLGLWGIVMGSFYVFFGSPIQKMLFSPHLHADGESVEVSSSTKHFSSFTVKQTCSIQVREPCFSNSDSIRNVWYDPSLKLIWKDIFFLLLTWSWACASTLVRMRSKTVSLAATVNIPPWTRSTWKCHEITFVVVNACCTNRDWLMIEVPSYISCWGECCNRIHCWVNCSFQRNRSIFGGKCSCTVFPRMGWEDCYQNHVCIKYRAGLRKGLA